PQLILPPQDPVCLSSGTLQLTANLSGGTWSGVGVDPVTGIVDLETAGIGTTTYTYEFQAGSGGLCPLQTATVDIEVLDSEPVTLAPARVCEGGPITQLSAMPADGSWMGDNVTSDGQFDPSGLAPGFYPVSFNRIDANDCDISRTLQVHVSALPMITALDTAVACLVDEEVLLENISGVSVDSLGGAFSWTVNGNPITNGAINPVQDLGAAGVYLVEVLYEQGECIAQADLQLEIVDNPQLILPPQDPVCLSSGTLQLTANLSGGTWSGVGVDPVTGIVDLETAGIGTTTYTYEFQAGSGGLCPLQTATVDVEVLDSEPVTLAPARVCEGGPIIQLSAMPADGSWMGDNVTSDGQFDPSGLAPGFYPVSFNRVDANGCNIIRTLQVHVSAPPNLTTSDTAIACLVDEEVLLQDIAGVVVDSAGGDFSWMVNGNPVPDGQINPEQDLGAAGVYPIVVIYDQGECRVESDFFIEIVDNPILMLTPQEPACINLGTIQLEANLGPGIWQGPGVDPNTGIVTLANVDLGPDGIETVTYTFSLLLTGSCAQEASQMVTIENPGAQVNAGPDESVCEGSAPTFTLAPGSPAGGTFIGDGIINSSTGEIDLSDLTPGETYTYTYLYDSPNASDCSATATKTLEYYRQPNAGFNIDGNLCINEAFTFVPEEDCDAVTFEWDPGDGSPVLTDCSPTYTYTTSGTFTQSLVVTTLDPEFCPNTSSQVISVTTPPSPAFDLVEREGCAPFPVQIIDQSSGVDLNYQWCIGGDTIVGDFPEGYLLDSFTADTWVIIELKLTNFCGTRTFVDSVLVRPYPINELGFSSLRDCSPFSPELINNTLGQPDSFYYDMGNGIVSSDSIPPAAVYTTPDDSISVYTIRFESYNECGADTTFLEITVDPPDVEAFISLDTSAGCQPYLLEPTSFSTPGAFEAWEVYSPSDSLVGTGSGDSPSILLEEAGVHTIILFAERCGADADTAFFEVYPAPEVSFIVDPQVCVGDMLSLQNTSPNLAGGIWDFGDGQTSEEQDPVHLYDTPGQYVVSFTGRAPITQCPNTAYDTVVVLGLPQVDFFPSDTSGCGPLSVSFSNGSTSENGSLTYVWDFGDGTNTSPDASPTHTYENSGTYAASLLVIDQLGCRADSVFNDITVHPDPISSFNLADDDLCLDNDSLLAIDQSQGETAIFWEVFGTQIPDDSILVLDLTVSGSYTLALIAENEFECRDTSSQSFSILPSPMAEIALDTNAICLDEALQLSSLSQFADGLQWTLGDGSGSTQTQFAYTYAEAGTYSITLVATNENDCPADTATIEVEINPLPDVAFDLFVPEECGTPAEVQAFNNSPTGLSYLWEASDGQTSTQPSPTFLFAPAGDYSLQLTAETIFGCTNELSQDFTVRGQPVADFDAPPRLACSPYRLRLNAQETEATRYEWYLNDDVLPVVGQQLDTLLDIPGIYSIRLVAIFDEVCQDEYVLFDAITLEPTPIADFDWEANTNDSILGDVQFLNRSQLADEYLWDFGDGNTSTEVSPYHEYQNNIDTLVTLIASRRYPGGLVCRDTAQREARPEVLNKFWVPTGMVPGATNQEYGLFGAKGVGVEWYHLRVFSKYGTLVWETRELDENDRPSGRWDGRLFGVGNMVQQGVYTWEVDGKFIGGNAIDRIGTVTVIR
ncbi:MAG: PKD domain-containing protein, partial [Bacteroidota bacterium]